MANRTGQTPYEYDNYTIDESRIPKEPRPLAEVMEELNAKIKMIRGNFKEKETA